MTTTATAGTFAERMVGAALGAADLFTVYIGERLGYYAALAEAPMTAPELAKRCGTNERFVREWLEQQAVTGIVEVDDAAAPADARRFSLPAGHAEVLTDPDSPAAMAWLPRLMVACGRALTGTIEGHRTGRGVSWSDFGPDGFEGQEGQNRPLFLGEFPNQWLPSIPEVHERLSAGGARVADVCCGTGLASIGIAKAYPDAEVLGLDLDGASIARAREHAAEHGVTGRVTFEARDAADPGLAGSFDLVFAFESIHDLAQPVEVLRAMRGLVAEGGTVLVIDENVAESFEAPAGDVERLIYAYSVLCCLGAGTADGGSSAATGAVMRPATLREYATEAGFSAVEVLPIEHDFFRVYRLR